MGRWGGDHRVGEWERGWGWGMGEGMLQRGGTVRMPRFMQFPGFPPSAGASLARLFNTQPTNIAFPKLPFSSICRRILTSGVWRLSLSSFPLFLIVHAFVLFHFFFFFQDERKEKDHPLWPFSPTDSQDGEAGRE